MEQQQFDLLRQNHEARQLQLIADLNQLKAELSHEKSVSAQLNQQIMLLTNSHASEILKLQAALAAAQLRTEQLTQISQDSKTELYDLRSERRSSQMQLDAARNEFFSLQRQNQSQKEELIKLQQKLIENQNASDVKIQTLKAAINGVSNMRNFKSNGFSTAVSALVDAGSDKEVFLAKIAHLSSQNEELTCENQRFESKVKGLENKLRQYQQAFGGNNVPSVQILMEQVENLNADKEELEGEMSAKNGKILKMRVDIDELVQENKRLRVSLFEMQGNFKNLQQIREVVRGMIDEEMGVE